jgi:hypothetical protein
MTIKFYIGFQNLTLGCGIMTATTTRHDSGIYVYDVNIKLPVYAVTVFSGTQPGAIDLISDWSGSNYNSQYLCHWPAVVLDQPNEMSIGQGTEIVLYDVITPATAANTGTASWAVLWPSVPDESSIQASSIPSTKFIIGSASDLDGNGIVKFFDTNLTQGTTYTIDQISIIASGGIA